MYFVMALLDVYANYFIVLALSYTTITSVTLLDALAIPASMILSRCFLKRGYTYVHLAGVILCLTGVVVNVMEDYTQVKMNTAVKSTMVKGDALAIVGGIMFGVNKVMGEISVRHFGGPYEYLGCIGMFGAIIACIHSIIFERQAISQTFFYQGGLCSQGEVWGLTVGFFFSGVFTYVGGAQFLLVSEATFYNLSLLTADAWSLGFSILAERITPAPLFYLALVFTLCGVVVYEIAPTPIMEDREAEEAAIEACGSGNKGGDIELKVEQGETA
jgi:solute carrier family 35 protein F1/2